MDLRADERGTQLTALMISPNRELAEAFARTLPYTRAFQILADLRAYPNRQTLEMRLRQLAPDVVFLDLSADFEKAAELIRCLAAHRPTVHVIGLHTRSDSEIILRSLRLGASEFLAAPFDPAVQRDAVARIRRLRKPETAPAREPGKIIVFSSAKPGSGASMLASQTAFAIRRITGARVLLTDFDLMGGTISFYLKLNPNGSLLDALAKGSRLDAALWNSLVTQAHGLDILPAPGVPAGGTVEPGRFHEFCEYARLKYDWVVLDLPVHARWTWPDPRVDAVRGQVAVERGPVVLALESVDLGADVASVEVLTDRQPRDEGGRVSVMVRDLLPPQDGWSFRSEPADGNAAGSEPRSVPLIAYHDRAERGPATMRVWLPADGR